jgi:hypothetical protein
MTNKQIAAFKNSDRYFQASYKFSHDESVFSREEIAILEEGRYNAWAAWKKIETEGDDSNFNVTNAYGNASDTVGKELEYDSEQFYRIAISTYECY